MRPMIFATLIALCTADPAHAAQMPTGGPVQTARPHVSVDDCRKVDDCYWIKHPQTALPPIPDMVCLFFVQRTPGNVELKLYLKNGKVRRYIKAAAVKDSICIGRHWLQRETDTAVICDVYIGHAIYDRRDVARLAQKTRESRDQTACLKGRSDCAREGYRVAP